MLLLRLSKAFFANFIHRMHPEISEMSGHPCDALERPESTLQRLLSREAGPTFFKWTARTAPMLETPFGLAHLPRSAGRWRRGTLTPEPEQINLYATI